MIKGRVQLKRHAEKKTYWIKLRITGRGKSKTIRLQQRKRQPESFRDKLGDRTFIYYNIAAKAVAKVPGRDREDIRQEIYLTLVEHKPKKNSHCWQLARNTVAEYFRRGAIENIKSPYRRNYKPMLLFTEFTSDRYSEEEGEEIRQLDAILAKQNIFEEIPEGDITGRELWENIINSFSPKIITILAKKLDRQPLTDTERKRWQRARKKLQAHVKKMLVVT